GILGQSGSTSIGGANPSLTRRSIATPSGQIYGVAGDGQLCVIVNREGAGWSSSCTDIATAKDFGAGSSSRAAPDSTDGRVQGPVPGGGTAVRVPAWEGG